VRGVLSNGRPYRDQIGRAGDLLPGLPSVAKFVRL
jgi:hypothetical protein